MMAIGRLIISHLRKLPQVQSTTLRWAWTGGGMPGHARASWTGTGVRDAPAVAPNLRTLRCPWNDSRVERRGCKRETCFQLSVRSGRAASRRTQSDTRWGQASHADADDNKSDGAGISLPCARSCGHHPAVRKARRRARQCLLWQKRSSLEPPTRARSSRPSSDSLLPIAHPAVSAREHRSHGVDITIALGPGPMPAKFS